MNTRRILIAMLSVATVRLTILMSSQAALQAQDAPLWRYTTTEKITFYQVTPLGDLLVATKNQVAVLDPETGDVRWARTDILKPPSGIISNPGPFPSAAFSPIPLTSFGVFRTKDGMAVVDLASGETLWDSTAVPLKKIRGHIAVPQHHMVLVYGETPESKRTLVGVDVGTGKVRWRQDSLFGKSPKIEKVNSIRFLAWQQAPLVDSDSTLILWLSKDGPMKLHARSGEVLWRSTFKKDPPLLSQGYAPMAYRNGVLYAPHKRKMVAFNAEDGSVVWQRRKNFRSPVVQMEFTDRAMVVRGRKQDENHPTGPGKDFFVALVDLSNGESLWGYGSGRMVNAPFVVFGEYVYVTTEKYLVALGLGDGKPVMLSYFILEDGEKPEMLRTVDGHLLISSQENHLLIDRNGTIRYHRHYHAPGLSLLESVAAIVASVASQALDNECERNPNCETSDWVVETDPRLVRRMRAGVDAAYFAYVFTDDPDDTDRKGFSLVKLDTRDGTEVGRVWIDKRRPEYLLDPITDMVFVKENDKEIYALAFPE